MSDGNNEHYVNRRTALAIGVAASTLSMTAAGAEPAGGAAAARGSADPAPDDILAAWRDYHAAAEQARLAIEATPRFRDNPANRPEAYHALVEAQAMAYNIAMAPRFDHPLINTRAWYSNVHTLGGTSADLYHVIALIDGRHSYRLRGRFGDLKVFVMQIFSHVFGAEGSRPLLNADFREMADADGHFEVILSAQRHEGHWLPLDPASDANMLFIRRFTDDWAADRGTLDIELIDGPIADDDQDPATVVRRIRRATAVLSYLISAWAIGFYDKNLERTQGRKNILAIAPGAETAALSAGSPSSIYYKGSFAMQADEAIIVEYERPDAAFWSLQLQTVWNKPINFIDRQSDINGRNAAVDRDGKVRFVIALEDPGVANWLDPDGRREGIIAGRAYHTRRMLSEATVTIVKARDVRRHLPADTVLVGPEARRAALGRRREALMKLYGDA